MKFRCGLIAFLLSLSILTAGQNLSSALYNSALIQDSLKIKSNAVVREALLEYSFLTPQSNKVRYRNVITVLNKNGDRDGVFVQYYDKFRKISSFMGNIYGADGMLIRKIKKSEFSDISGSAGYPLFDDIRYKYFKPLISNYPYTVEYECEVEISGSYYFPEWKAFEGYNVSIEKTEFTMVVPAGYELLYKQYNFPDQPIITKADNYIRYSWNAQNLISREEEPYSDDRTHYFKAVYTAPSQFILDGHPGKLDSWKDFADWCNQLNEGRDNLPESTVAAIRELIKDIPGDRQKVKKLYSYLQEKTRYFSIALGLGGLQPVDAKVVDEVGYGDCKGLSNYMKALLKAAGIESYYTLVNSGEDFPQIEDDFPSDQFNHIILCVPLPGDTIWLECTSQNIPFGFLGRFTSDRKVLLIKNQGGELARTPVYSLPDNYQNTTAKVSLTQDGNARAEVCRKFGGLQFDDHSENLHEGLDDQKEWLYDYIDLPDFKIGSCEFHQNNPDKAESELQLTLNINMYGSVSGKRIFIPVNLVNRSTYIPPKVKKRWSDIEKVISYVDNDSVEYTLPEGVEIEFLPEKTEINSAFGTYASRLTASNHKITYVRKIEMFKGIYPRDRYDDFIKFYHDINIADKAQAVLLKK